MCLQRLQQHNLVSFILMISYEVKAHNRCIYSRFSSFGFTELILDFDDGQAVCSPHRRKCLECKACNTGQHHQIHSAARGACAQKKKKKRNQVADQSFNSSEQSKTIYIIASSYSTHHTVIETYFASLSRAIFSTSLTEYALQ